MKQASQFTRRQWLRATAATASGILLPGRMDLAAALSDQGLDRPSRSPVHQTEAVGACPVRGSGSGHGAKDPASAGPNTSRWWATSACARPPNMHNTSEVLCANTEPQRACPPKAWRRRNSLFTKGPSEMLEHATSEIASGSKLGIDATMKIPGESCKRPWPPLIKMSEDVRRKIDVLFGSKPA